MTSNLSAFAFIPERAPAVPALWNDIFSILSSNIAAVGSSASLSSPSGNTVSISTNLEVIGGAHFQHLSIGSTPPSYLTTAAVTIEVNSAFSDYLYLVDSSAQKSSYIIGSRAGGLADGLNIWDASAGTMIVSFSKQSIRFFQNVVGPVFDVGGALASTLNAATFGTGTDSKESRIQAAISAASIAGIARVYVPANMYPYSAGSISFETRVQMVREGGNWSVWDVRAYGASGNIVTDDTKAIQATINAVVQNNANGAAGAIALGPVYIPAGTYKITSSLTAGQVTGLHIAGAGNSVTEILPSANMQSLFDLEGFAYSSLGNLDVQVAANSFVTNLIYLHYDGIGPRTSAAWVLYDMFLGRNSGSFGTYVTAVAMGTNNILQVDTSYIRNVSIQGAWGLGNDTTYQQGFDLGNGQAGNTLNISLYDCSVGYVANGIRANGAGAINGHGLFFRSNNTNLNFQGTQAEMAFRGIRVEDSHHLLGSTGTGGGGASGSAVGIHLADVTWSMETVKASRDIIFVMGSGVAVLENINFQTISATTIVPRITINAGGGAQAGKSGLIIRGLTTGPFTPAQTFAQCFGPVLVEGYVQTPTGQGSVPTIFIPFLVYDNPGFFTPPSQAQFGPGLATAPSLTFSSETSLGFYRSGASAVGLAYGQLQSPTGTALQPPLTYSSESSLGWYRSGVSTMGLSYGALAFPAGSNATPSITFSSETSLGFYRSASSTIAMSYGTFAIKISTANFLNIGNVTNGYFGDDSNLAARFPGATGDFYIQSAGGGTSYFRSGAGLAGTQILSGYLGVPSGSATTPGFTYTSDLSVGFYRSGVSTIAQSAGTFNLATNAVRLSMRTLAASAVTTSAAKTNVAVNEVVFTLGAGSGATLLIYSGGTVYGFNSSFSVPAA